MKQNGPCLSSADATVAADEFFEGGDLFRSILDQAAHDDVADVVTPRVLEQVRRDLLAVPAEWITAPRPLRHAASVGRRRR